jgi:gliding motility-associated-like protein
MCFGFPPYFIELNAGNAGSTFAWSHGETNGVVAITEPGTYSVGVTTAFGCFLPFYVEVEDLCDSYIYIPNAFTPNNDGINDFWMVYGERIEEFHLNIFNRWGELIFETDDINKPWLGQRRDGEHYSENGVYLYQVKYRSRDKFGVLSDRAQLSGYVTLAR